VLLVGFAGLFGSPRAGAADVTEAEHRLDAGRRPGLRRPRGLRPGPDRDAEPGPVGGRGDAVHTVLCGEHGLCPVALLLMTGRNTGHARVRGNSLVPLRPEDVTVAEVLKAAGYATGLFGKWGLGEGGKRPAIRPARGSTSSSDTSTRSTPTTTTPIFSGRARASSRWPGTWRAAERDRGPACPVCPRPDHAARPRLHRAAQGGVVLSLLCVDLAHANNERGSAEGNGMEVPSDAPYSDRPWPQTEKNHAAMIGHLGR